MTDSILLALALVCLMEGLGPLLFPKRWKRLLKLISAMPASNIRQIGLSLVGVSIILFYVINL
ncbi:MULTISPECIES: DUF2065 domain-containing protein [unclassified Agarivorans]|uniref:DUF2065 domain-containing protein n=1 Tax=unclassified Agarivorans TaxID=2636026 RepID=UPI0010F7B414|nr:MULTISPECIES: DUF2065 family protein [unclassified Agarivorans]MDO6766053.1 DUF2065 family protein [Agarivorans sp. 1_MG-2023]